MQRWFLSYHSPDQALAERLKTAIERKDPTSRVFMAVHHNRAGGFWTAQLAQEIADATAFILLVGERGLGPWQVLEYDEALDKRVKSPDFPLVLMLMEGQNAPGLPFLRRVHWIVAPDPASDIEVAKLFDASAGAGSRPGELWRHAAPYRGLAAMTEEDSDYFFGRTSETVELLNAIAVPEKLPILIGNSGVGKSSLAQAGVLAALKRQAWPDQARVSNQWPEIFQNSRQWLFLKLKPGTEPLRALVAAFLDCWQFAATDPERVKHQNGWIELLRDDKATLRDLIDATERRRLELDQSKPSAFFLYVDQGEELYVRADERQRKRFSELLGQALTVPRFRAMMSLRSDFLGHLQNDGPLFKGRLQIDVPPLGEPELRQVISQPAELLSARFESPTLVDIITRRTVEDSVKDVGALPLLSYTLDDMWTQMVRQGDGILRLPAQSFELGGVLVSRASSFLAAHAESEAALRRVLTIRCATVRPDGEPTRRRAPRSEFSDQEWRLVSELADYPNRLLVTVTHGGETYTEVAHEAIFRRWDKLKEWIAAERGFLAWRSGLEFAKREWEATPARSKSDALLRGFALRQARGWLSRRPEDIPAPERDFIVRSRRRVLVRRLAASSLVAAASAALAIWWQWPWVNEHAYALLRAHPLSAAQERALMPLADFTECADCPKMVVIPSGSVTIGYQPNPDEQPTHMVTFERPFAVSAFELTFDQWQACVAHGDCTPVTNDNGWGRGRQPVINVSWKDAKQYVAWLGRITGKDYRLLTEAEWEYAARANPPAGHTTHFSFGNDDAVLDQYAWFALDSDGQPHPVGEKKPSRFQLYDMHGNVSEWVEDCYQDNYRDADPNGAAWTGGNCTHRVIRGGSWVQRARMLRSAARDWWNFDKGSDSIGIRVGRSLPP